MANREESERCAEADLAGAGHEPRIERLAATDDVEQKSPCGQIGEREGYERDQVLQQVKPADVSTADLESQPAHARGDRARACIEGDVAEGPAAEHSSCEHACSGDQGAGPRAEHDHCGDLYCGSEPEALPLHWLTGPLAIRFLEELHEDDRTEEEGKRRLPDPGDPAEGDSEHAEAEADRDQRGAGGPHTALIGQNRPPA